MPVKDGSSCPGCGLANYEGMCPVCRGDPEAYEYELVPPFESLEEEEPGDKNIRQEPDSDWF